MIHGAPQVDHLAVQLHVNLVQVPAPAMEAPHPAHPLTMDVATKQRFKSVPS
jgi:hypothetical protein